MALCISDTLVYYNIVMDCQRQNSPFTKGMSLFKMKTLKLKESLRDLPKLQTHQVTELALNQD